MFLGDDLNAACRHACREVRAPGGWTGNSFSVRVMAIDNGPLKGETWWTTPWSNDLKWTASSSSPSKWWIDAYYMVEKPHRGPGGPLDRAAMRTASIFNFEAADEKAFRGKSKNAV